MIAFFPEPYPDELIYSWFARYAVRTGYTNYRAVAEDLFASNTAKPNLEFLMELSDDGYAAVTRNMPFETVIINHTMFPYYARFLPADRRRRAFELLLNMDKRFNDALYIRRNKTQHRQYLRYCPYCVLEDRKVYGETYWHRVHQLDQVEICPIHGCSLLDSVVDVTSKASPSLIHAEEVIPDQLDITTFGSELELSVAQYVVRVFHADLNMDNQLAIGQFLHRKMEHTKYLSVRGQKRYLATLAEDFFEYYKDLDRTTLTEVWQLGKIFSGYCFHTYDISLLAMFLGISASDLVKMAVPEKSQVQLFDEQILTLHSQGLNYRQIANKLGASYDYCKLVSYRQKRITD